MAVTVLDRIHAETERGINLVYSLHNTRQEEDMVKAIIARVKIECAMEGEDCSRRGYQKH